MQKNKLPQIAVLQSLSTDADNKGPFFSPFLQARGYGGFEIRPTLENLKLLQNKGEMIAVSGETVSARFLDGIMWRAKVSEGFETSCKIQELLADRYKVATMENPKTLQVAASKVETARSFQLYNRTSREGGIAIPSSTAIRRGEIGSCDFEDLFAKHAGQHSDGSDAVMFKPEFGFSGKGIFIIRSAEDLEAKAQISIADKMGFVVQDLIINQDKSTIRVDIAGDKPIHTLRFHPKEGSENSTSGRVEKIEDLPNDIIDLAFAANKAMGGLFFAGVDIMQDKDGNHHVLEVNIPGVWYLDNQGLGLKDACLGAVTDAFVEKIARGQEVPAHHRR